MAELYYNQLDDDQRSKITFVALNDDGAARDLPRLKASGNYNGKQMPTVQDENGSPMMNALSNNNQMPKDDMILFDKNGQVIQYFTMSKSNMGNRQSNNIKTAVMDVLKEDYKSPCGGGDDGKGEMSAKDALMAHCKKDSETCAACKGKVRGNRCVLKKRLKCKFMQTEELCKKAECSYKPPKRGKKAKCKGKGIF